MAVLKFKDPTGLWQELPTIGPEGPTGDTGATGATGPQGPPGVANEVAIDAVKPTDPAIELWVNTATSLATDAWEPLDRRYAKRDPRLTADVDAIVTSGYWIADSSTVGARPPGGEPQIVHALVLSSQAQIQYAYDLLGDGDVPKVHVRRKRDGSWSAWVNVTPVIAG